MDHSSRRYSFAIQVALSENPIPHRPVKDPQPEGRIDEAPVLLVPRQHLLVGEGTQGAGHRRCTTQVSVDPAFLGEYSAPAVPCHVQQDPLLRRRQAIEEHPEARVECRHHAVDEPIQQGLIIRRGGVAQVPGDRCMESA